MRSAVQNGVRDARRPVSGRRGSGAFTLVELLVVVAVIGLLVSILVPVVQTVLASASAARTRARVIELATGCYNYKKERDYYPGQDTYAQLGPLTGSQLLAACLFEYPFADVSNSSRPPPVSGKYAPMRAGDLDKFKSGSSYQATYTGKLTSILDRAEDPMAILYYPYRIHVTSDEVKERYKYSDNSWYVDRVYSEYVAAKDKTSYSLQQYRTDMQEAFYGFSTTAVGTVRGEGAFLLIAAGKDRLYFTGDDIRYPD